MENYIPPVGNDFPAITHLAIESETIDACQVMLVKIKSKMLPSLVFTWLGSRGYQEFKLWPEVGEGGVSQSA